MAYPVSATGFRSTTTVTLSDSTDNLPGDCVGFSNKGTSGVLNVIFKDGLTGLVPLAQYEYVMIDGPRRVKSTSTTVTEADIVVLRG